MRYESVLYQVLHVPHDAKCFPPMCILAPLSTTIRQLYSITKMATYGSYEYEEEGSGSGLNRK